MQSEAKRVVQAFEDACERAFTGGSMEDVFELLDPEVVIHEVDSVPYPGTFRGHEGFVQVGGGFQAAWEMVGPLRYTLIGDADEDKVVSIVQVDVKSRATGRPFDLRMTEIYTVRDGRIVDIDMYYRDTAAMAAVTDGVKVV